MFLSCFRSFLLFPEDALCFESLFFCRFWPRRGAEPRSFSFFDSINTPISQNMTVSGTGFFSYIEISSSENGCPSPDGRENPFEAGFAAKDWKDSGIKLLILEL